MYQVNQDCPLIVYYSKCTIVHYFAAVALIIGNIEYQKAMIKSIDSLSRKRIVDLAS
ncbi:hypothetical protein [Peribacillus butanolivorans]